MHQGLTMLLLGYFPETEPKFFLLLGLFILFSNVQAVPPEFVHGIGSCNDRLFLLLLVEEGTSHIALIITWALQILLLQPEPHRSRGTEVRATFQEPVLKRWGSEASGTKEGIFPLSCPQRTFFFLTTKLKSCHCDNIINSTTSYTESSLQNVLW